MDSNFNFNEDNKQFKLMENQDEKGTFYRPKWELKPKGQPHPARRWCHTATNHDKFLYILGGRLAESAKIKQFAYKINCETFAYEQIQLSDNLMMRESHSCSLIGDSLYVLFGMKKSEKVLNDCLQLKLSPNGIIWQKKVQKPEIDSRESHMSLVLDERYILIYGGMDGEEKLIQNFYIYDTEKEIWKDVLNFTGAVQVKVGGTLINIKNQIYLFGGQINDQNQYSNQIYKIQIRNYTHNDKDLKPEISITKLNVLGQRPMPRSQFASVAFKDRYLLVLGGEGPIKDKSQFPTLLSDIWSFDTERMVWEEIIPENPSVFKPRSSFTATIYKDNLIVFGGLVSLKDYRTTDEMLVLNLNTQVQKRPICSLCKSSYKVIPKEQVEVTNSRATLSLNNFSTGISLVLAISKTIEHPFTALCSLLHSFVPFQIEKCFFSLREQKLCMNLKKFEISQNEWSHILNSYEFTPLIQQRDPRVNNALKHEIRHNMVNYLAYNLKNSCFRLGGQLLISRISNKNELQMCLMNKFGIYHTQNISSQGKYNPSATSIILQYLKQHEIQLSQLFQNSLTICITSLKTENSTSDKKQIIFDLTSRDIICQDNFKFKNFMEIGFSKNLPFKLALSNQQSSFIEEEKFFDIKPNRLWESKQDQEDKWPQENLYPDIFQDIFTYEAMAGSVILVYQNNKLMHKTQLKKSSGTVYEFHLTKNIQPNLTFSDIIPTDRLLNAIKAVVKGLNTPVVKALKREKPCERQQLIQNCGASPGKGEYWEHPTKAVKTNEPENCDNSMEIQGAVRQDGEC